MHSSLFLIALAGCTASATPIADQKRDPNGLTDVLGGISSVLSIANNAPQVASEFSTPRSISDAERRAEALKSFRRDPNGLTDVLSGVSSVLGIANNAPKVASEFSTPRSISDAERRAEALKSFRRDPNGLTDVLSGVSSVLGIANNAPKVASEFSTPRAISDAQRRTMRRSGSAPSDDYRLGQALGLAAAAAGGTGPNGPQPS